MNNQDPHVPLTAELVKSRLAGHVPSNIQKHWVEVDGLRWPVTQALTLVTGEIRVKSNRARRDFRRLGFHVGNEMSPTPTVARARARAAPSPPPMLVMNVLAPLDSAAVTVSYRWLGAGPITLDVNGYPLFPALPLTPGLYRFDFGVGDDGLRDVYIGEGKSIANRAAQYRNAKVDRKRPLTSRRLHRTMVAHLGAGGEIQMSIVVGAHFANGSPVNFGQKSGRLLVESAAVVLAQLDPAARVLNVDRDVVVEQRGTRCDISGGEQ